MIILLTGSHGFLGSHTKRALESAGHTVWTFFRGTNTIGDTCVSNCDVIVNCAGETENPDNMWSANVAFPMDLLRAANVFKKRMIHVGTIAEDLEDDSVYRATKRAATQMLLAYAEQYGVQLMIVRPATIYGVGDKDTAFLPTLWRAYTEGKPFRPTNEFRGWVHVEDVARAIVRLVREGYGSPDTYEVCTDYIHNLAICDLFAAAVDSKVNLDLSSAREEGTGWPRYSCDDLWELGWSPLWNIERGVRDFALQKQCEGQVWTGAEA